MKKLRVLALMHEDLVPPDNARTLPPEKILPYKMEWDVVRTLGVLKHEVLKLGVRDEISPIRQAIHDWKPHIAFNLLEEFDGTALFDHHLVSYLELMRTPYTGCNPRGLVLARDKATSKKILAYHRIKTPAFAVFRIGRKVKRPQHLKFPLIVKSLIEEASAGISQASIVENDEKLLERVAFIHENIGTDALVERYIDGREFYVGVIGNQRLQTFPVWELLFRNMPEDSARIATAKVKWDRGYQKKNGITSGKARNLSTELTDNIHRVSRRIYRILGLSGYARLDFRMSKTGVLYFLEANPNPQIARDEDFADAADSAGIPYTKLIQRVVSLGLRHTSKRLED